VCVNVTWFLVTAARAWLLVLYERRAELKRARQDDLNADL